MFIGHSVNNAHKCLLLLDNFRSKVYVLLFKVHSECELYNYDQQDVTIFYYLFLKGSTCFGRCLRPSSGAHNCTFSFTYCQPILLQAVIVPSHPWYQPAAVLVGNTWSWMCSYVFLMMGGGTARNMQSLLELNNKKQLHPVSRNYKVILTMHGHTNIKRVWTWDIFILPVSSPKQ